MSKHTPGPWRVNPGAGEVRGADWNVIVADVTDEQDSLLIAAAPDLLAVCADLVGMSDAGAPCPPRLVVMARLAVAKAKGGYVSNKFIHSRARCDNCLYEWHAIVEENPDTDPMRVFGLECPSCGHMRGLVTSQRRHFDTADEACRFADTERGQT